jgi:drug/metabolite transporter (DMT)-like permease
MAVAIRAALRHGADAGSVTFATTTVALATTLVLSAPWLPGAIGWHGLWPFLLAGLVAPGLSQLAFVRAIASVGASRTAILVGVSPVLSALFAVTLLDEPVRAGLVAGTAAIVGGGLALVWTRSPAARLTVLGATLGVAAAALIAARDNFVRWAETGNDVSGLVAASAILLSATAFIALLLAAARRPLLPAGLRRAWRPVVVAGVLFGTAYAAVFVAFDHGRVTIVAPLYATESLWAVLWSAAILGAAEAIGPRLVVAALLMVVGGALIGVSR